jgi:hypothetical protein
MQKKIIHGYRMRKILRLPNVEKNKEEKMGYLSQRKQYIDFAVLFCTIAVDYVSKHVIIHIYV